MDLEHNNLSNPYQDVISIHQAHNILSQNISSYLSNLKQEEKSSMTKTKDQLITIYKKELEKYKLKQNIMESKTYSKLLFDFQKIRNGFINLENCEYAKNLKNCKEEHELLNNLKYDAFKQVNLEYYNNCKQLKNSIDVVIECINKEMLMNKKITDSISINSLLRDTNKKLGDIFDYYSNDILKKVLNISKSNFGIENQSMNNLKESINISSLFNSIYNKNNLH